RLHQRQPPGDQLVDDLLPGLGPGEDGFLLAAEGVGPPLLAQDLGEVAGLAEYARRRDAQPNEQTKVSFHPSSPGREDRRHSPPRRTPACPLRCAFSRAILPGTKPAHAVPEKSIFILLHFSMCSPGPVSDGAATTSTTMRRSPLMGAAMTGL